MAAFPGREFYWPRRNFRWLIQSDRCFQVSLVNFVDCMKNT